MKKITYFLVLLLAVSSCKFNDEPYSIVREFDGGTFITPDGKVKYISANPDSLIIATDNYAIIQTGITYVKKNEDKILSDSILIYGHVYSKSPNPVVCGYDSVGKIDLINRLNKRAKYTFKGSGSKPNAFLTSDDLKAGMDFRNGFGLLYETEYYVRSFVVTGRFENGEPVYEDIAYNQRELKFTTDTPLDLWVGGTMENAPSDFPSIEYKGATSFTYDGYMFVVQGHASGSLGTHITLYRYDPQNNIWEDNIYNSFNIGFENNFTNAVSFVIENVKINGVTFDYLYLGLGKKDNNSLNSQFYRLDLSRFESNWTNITNASNEANFPGQLSQNAIGFSIGGIGYVLGGTYTGSVGSNYYVFDPNERSGSAVEGTWRNESSFIFQGGARTEAVSFKIGEEVYLFGGRDNAGNFKSDLYRCNQTYDKSLRFTPRAGLHDTLARVDAIGFALGENGYIGLGRNANGDVLRDFWRYNPFTNLWDRRADFGMIKDEGTGQYVAVGNARYEAVGAGIKISDDDYRGYVGTGWNGSWVGPLNSGKFNDFWHYRP